MREVPRRIPTGLKLQALTSGLFFLVGLTFFIAAISFILFRGFDELDWTRQLGAAVFLLWGFSLMVYKMVRNRARLRLLIWGRLYLAELVSREKSHTDFVGRVSFDCRFEYTYHNRSYGISIMIPEAYEMEEGNYYVIVLNEDNPEDIASPFQFSKQFTTFFLSAFEASIQQAKRNQRLD